jgi:tetratricopeptide (TPR) repeat protein
MMRKSLLKTGCLGLLWIAVGAMAGFAQNGPGVGSQPGSLLITGKVSVAGGVLPWDPIPVIVTCQGKATYNGVSDTEGGFKIEATSTTKDNGGNPLYPQLGGCTVGAVLDGFKSSSITLNKRGPMDDPGIGTLTLTPDPSSPGSAMSSTTASAPKDALKAYDKAREESAQKKTADAQKDLEKAVKAYPQFADAWYQLGKMAEQQQKPQDAYADFQKAAAADPKFSRPYLHVALLASQQQKWQETLDATNKALALDPEGTPQIWYFNALANMNLGHKEVAETNARKALAMDPSHLAPNTEQLLAVILAGRGQIAEALEHLKNSLTYTPPGPNADLIKKQIAQLEGAAPAK